MNADFPRVQVLPGLDRASFRVDGAERLAYEFGSGGPRPFLYPLIGPSGRELTRLGHPEPVGHEHHHAIWFGHQNVHGVNFWEERPGRDVSVRHKRVVAYRDGLDWGGLAAEWDWWADGRSLMKQGLRVALAVEEDGSLAIDLSSRFEVEKGPVDLGKTNFGFLGVRVAKTMSERFGGGRLTADDGATGEGAIFGKRYRWVDYTGPTAPGVVEGIAYFDHPSNPGHPAHWHVRADGWFEAAFNLAEAWGLAAGHPLDLRYRLWVHGGKADGARIDASWREFARSADLELAKDAETRLSTLRRGKA